MTTRRRSRSRSCCGRRTGPTAPTRLTKLADPKGLWGASDSIHDLANKASASKLPQVAAWMRDFKMSETQLGSLEAAIQKAGQGNTEAGVKAWMAANPGTVNKMAPIPAH